jgi:rubrerythrin
MHMATTPTIERVPTLTTESPVDDPTYNIIAVLASKLEAIDTYRKYSGDGRNDALWQRLAEDDRRHADLLLEELRSGLNTPNR